MAGVFTQQGPHAAVSRARTRTRKQRLGATHKVVLALALVASIAVGYVGYERYSPSEVTAVQLTTTPVRRGTITASVNLMGSVAATSQAKLTFETAGRLTQVLVKAGDNFKQGDPLAKVDTSDLELQVAQASVTLEQANLKLADLKAGAKPEDVAAAQAAIRNAEVALANAQDNLVLANKSTAVTKDIRDRQYEHSFYEVKYGDVLKQFNDQRANQEDVDKAWAALLTAKERLDSAKLTADLTIRKSENDVRQAEDNLSKARSQLETIQAGTSSADIKSQEVAVRLGDATLKQRQLAFQKATLVAPFDGTIDSISANVGEQVSTAKEVMTIINLQKFRVDARVDETDVSRLAAGQTASITVEALAGERLTAKVVSIAANPTVQQGVVNYPVTLELDPTRAPVRPGMTASIAVEAARRENVVLAPNRAVRTQGRNRTVEVMVDGKTETRTVSVGMSNDQFTEISSGLQEGDVVVIPSTTTATPRVGQAGGFGGMPGGGVMVPGGFGR
ncbi:MAG: efflux RND transporter periplasmic adaptor subunit [Chloroflexi bacterium]|nr:efflux RND transporter periplasmic adaptor subunit [Chloroflexota bacterium]